MADALSMNIVNAIVRRSAEAINVDIEGQTLYIQGPRGLQQQQPPVFTLTAHDVQYIVSFLQSSPRGVVDALFIVSFLLTVEALEILRAYFTSETMSLRYIRFNEVNLGNVNCARLLSGLHGNNTVTRLDLYNVGLHGQAGGTVLSELLQHNSSLTAICCARLRLGAEAIRALQVSLGANQTIQKFYLGYCNLGNEGFSIIVDALQGNTTMKQLSVIGNGITSKNSLRDATRLLQHTSLEVVAFNHNPGLFDDKEVETTSFLNALRNNTTMQIFLLNYCQIPGHVVVAIFQALSTKTTTSTSLSVYDNTKLQGANLESLLEIIPHTRNITDLCINLDFMDESVLSSFHQNSSIRHLNTFHGTVRQPITSGPVFDILKRNRYWRKAIMLLDSAEPQRMMIPLGLWSKAIEHLTHVDNTGATAAFKIMQEQLAMWMVPHQVAVVASSISGSKADTTAAAAAASAIATAAATSVEAAAASNTTDSCDAEMTKIHDTKEDDMAVSSPPTNCVTTHCTDKRRRRRRRRRRNATEKTGL